MPNATPENNHTIDQHFAGRSPVVRDIYNALLTAAGAFGRIEEDPKKTSIHLNRKSAFAGVQTRGTFLVLTVKAARDIDDARISRRERASANRWHHEIKIADADEIDSRVIGWLRDSYELSG